MDRPETISLGDLLKEQGLLSDAQLQSALAEQGRSGRKLARVIAETGLISEEVIARFLARKLHGRYVDLRVFSPPAEVVALLPESSARRYRAMVLGNRDDRLEVGFSDPTDRGAVDEVGRMVGREIALAVVTESDLLLAMNHIYSGVTSSGEAPQGGAPDDDALLAQCFDLHLTLQAPLDKDTLARRLTEVVGIEADRLDAVVEALQAGRSVRIRSEITRPVADKVAEDARRAGFAADIRESLRLMEFEVAAPTVKSMPCPACGTPVVPEETPTCPHCGLLLAGKDAEAEYLLKKRIEEEERLRVERQNEQTRKSNEQLRKDEEEQKLRDEARAQLERKKVEDLRLQKDAELRKKAQNRRAIQWAAGAVIALSVTFVAGRWFASKSMAPNAVSSGAAQAAAGNGPSGAKTTSPNASAGAPGAVAPSGVARAVNQAGRMELVEGDVQLLDSDRKPRAAKAGDVINEGDRIVTGKGGEVHVKMRDEGFIAVRPNTDLQIVAYRAQGDDQDKGIIALAKGRFRSVTGWIGKFNPSAYQVKTPISTMGVRGTDHEPLVILSDSPEGAAGAYDKVYVGATYIETAKGRVEVPAGKVGFAAGAANVEPTLPRLLPEAPQAYLPTRNEHLITPRHEAIQKITEQQRNERRKQVEQVCRKD